MQYGQAFLLVALILVAGTSLGAQFIPAFAATCIELGNCEFDNFMQRIIYPYRVLIGDYIYVLFWGSLLGIIYIRTHSGMITSFAGLVIASMFTSADVYISSQTGQVFYWGYALVMVSMGLTLYFLIKTRIHQP